MTDTSITAVELTDQLIRKAAVPDGEAQIILKDLKQGGLIVRVRSSGSRSFYYRHTRPGRKGSFKTFIGKFPSLNVAAARRQAAVLAGQRAAGIDLTIAKREQKAAAIKAARDAAAVVTLGDLIGEPKDGKECPYAVARKGERIKNWKLELGYLRRALLPEHHNTGIRELERRHVMTAVNRLNAAGKRGAADAVWKYSFAFFGWVLEQGLADRHPLVNVRRKRKGSRADRLEREAKGRALDDQEIAKVWHAAGDMGVFGLLVRASLLGGFRRAEAAQLRWSDVLNDRIIVVAEHAKGGKPHAVPLTELLNSVLADAAKLRRAGSDYVFPSPRTGGPVKGFSTQVDRLVRNAGVARFTMHDLRRSARSCMSRLGISNETQRLAIGQQPEGLDRIYNMDDRWPARCAAFKTYHNHIASLLGGNVISFQDHAQVAAAG